MKKIIVTQLLLFITITVFCQASPTKEVRKKYGKNGELVSETEYMDGKINGKYKFYMNGKLVLETEYINNKANGISKHYDPHGGILVYEAEYKDGIEIGEKRYKEGLLISNYVLYTINENGEKVINIEKVETINWLSDKINQYGSATNLYLPSNGKYRYFTIDFVATNFQILGINSVGYESPDVVRSAIDRNVAFAEITNIVVTDDDPRIILKSVDGDMTFMLDWDKETDLKNRVIKALKELIKQNLPKEKY